MIRNIEDYTRVSQILGIFQAYSFVEPGRLKKAQDIGTSIHLAIEDYFKEGFTTLTNREAPYFESFLKWAEQLHPLPIAQETRLYDDSLMVTGQFDLLAGIGGENWLIDFKTGSWEHPEIWELQMTWYRHLMEGSEMTAYLPNKFMIVQLMRDGEAPKLFEFEYDKYKFEVCMAALKCYRFFKIGLC